jgi:hypothetical protein
MVSKADLEKEKIKRKGAEERYRFKCIAGLLKNKK